MIHRHHHMDLSWDTIRPVEYILLEKAFNDYRSSSLLISGSNDSTVTSFAKFKSFFEPFFIVFLILQGNFNGLSKLSWDNGRTSWRDPIGIGIQFESFRRRRAAGEDNRRSFVIVQS